MIFQYNLVLLFLCVFTALSVSTETCGKDLLVGTSCIIKLITKNNGKVYEIKWTHDRNGVILRWKDGKIKTQSAGVSKEEDGSLRFQSVSLKDTGTYSFYAFDPHGSETGKGEVGIKVYEKAPKPAVNISCSADGNASLTCDVGNSKDPNLTVSWYEDGKPVRSESEPQVFLSSNKVQENKLYSCVTRNPVSEDKSENVTVSCLRKMFGLDFWTMVSIIAGGGALVLLLMCVVVIFECRRCQRHPKHQQDEDEYRLADLPPDHTGSNRSKQSASGQPAPPIPQEDPPSSCSTEPPTRTPPRPKAQIRARPPPPPQDEDEEDPPPLPRPRNKQHQTKRNQEPY